jgi:hypothetical protein
MLIELLCTCHVACGTEVEKIHLLEARPESEVQRGKDRLQLALTNRQRQSIDDPFDLETDDIDPKQCFLIKVIPGGHNLGRGSLILCKSEDEREFLTRTLRALVAQAKDRQERLLNPGALRRCQVVMKKVWNTRRMQVTTSCAILASYLTTLLEAQFKPEAGSHQENTFYAIECFFTVFFTVELLINFGAHFWSSFLKEWPNIFDLVVVCATVVGLFFRNVPGVLVLRIFRLARLLRIMRIVKSVPES